MSQSYVAIDVDTTGLDSYEDAVIEVAVVTLTEDKIVDEWSSLINPGREVPPFITKLTGISDEMVEDAPSLRSMRSKVQRLIGDNVVIGHNVSFDMRFLEQAYIGAGAQRMDTLTLATILMPEMGRYALGELTRALALDKRGRQGRLVGGKKRKRASHRALAQPIAADLRKACRSTCAGQPTRRHRDVTGPP